MRYDYHIGWNITKIISWLISLESLLFADSDIVRLHQRKHYESDEILARIGTGGGSPRTNYVISSAERN